MGGEAKNATRDIPIAVILSLLIQGSCYLFEYYAANYYLSSGYSMQSASGSAAPIGDMMIVVGDALLGPGHGRIFMLAEAFTVFLAIFGTTLSCMNTAARVTYAMGKDDEASEHFGLLHSENLTPHRAVWTLAGISALVGCAGVVLRRCRCTDGCRDCGYPAWHLLQLRLLHQCEDGSVAKLAPVSHPHLQLWYIHPVWLQLPAMHGGLP
jgi:hypothetical protein